MPFSKKLIDTNNVVYKTLSQVVCMILSGTIALDWVTENGGLANFLLVSDDACFSMKDEHYYLPQYRVRLTAWVPVHVPNQNRKIRKKKKKVQLWGI